MMMLTSLSRNPILAKSNPSIRIKQASLESTLQTSHTKLEKKIKTLGFVVSHKFNFLTKILLYTNKV